jgi:hypothetical protein
MAMHINVKDLIGKTISFAVTPNTTIAQLKLLIQEREGFPPSHQIVVFAAAIVEDSKSMAEANINNGSTVHLVIRPPLPEDENEGHYTKQWASHELWGVRNSNDMFGLFDVPPIADPKLVDLKSVESHLYYAGDGEPIIQYGKTYTPFYHDCQESIYWCFGPDGKIYWPRVSDGKMIWCADSMEEFSSRIAIEASLWQKLEKINKQENIAYSDVTKQREAIKKNWDQFTSAEQSYIQFYFEKDIQEDS